MRSHSDSNAIKERKGKERKYIKKEIYKERKMLNGLNIINSVNRINGAKGTNKLNWNLTPDTPTVTINSNTSLTIDWVITGLDKEVTAVELWHSTDGTTYTRLVKLGAVTTYDHTGLENNSIHYYKVRYWSGVYVSGFSGVVSGTTFITAAYNYFVAMSTQLSQAQKLVINAAIKSTATILAKMDYVNLTLATEQQSMINLVDPSKSGTKVGSPIFTPYLGWQGNGNNYVNTGYNFGDGGTYKIQQNNGTIGFYCNKQTPQSTRVWASNWRTSLYGLSVGIYSDGTRPFGEVNRDENSSAASCGVLIKEFITNRRSTETAASRGFNRWVQNYNYASNTPRNQNLIYGMSADRGCMFYVGSFLTNDELFAFQDAWLPVLEYFGSDYWSNFTPSTPSLTVLGANSIKIDWTNAATTYSPYTLSNVKVQISTNGTDFIDLETLANVTTYTAIGLNPSTQYWFRLIKKSSRNIWTQYTDSANETTTA